MHASRRGRLLQAAVCSVVWLAGRPAAAQAPTARVAGRIHVQYRASFGDSSSNYNEALVSNGFEIRRLRIQSDVRFGDNINLVIMPSFEMGALRMRDAFLRVGLSRGFGVTLGQEKSPFQRYDLTSSNTLPSIERGLRVLRLSGKEALNDLLITNGYASHDIGAFFDYAAAERRFTLKAGVQNGSRESAADVNNAKSLFARATATVRINAARQALLQLGASFAARDRAICSTCTGVITYFADSSRTTTAFAVDFEWGGFRPGWHVIGGFAAGDNVPTARRVNSGRNTGNLRNSADTNVVTFLGVSVVGAYRLSTHGSDTRLVTMIEPALRLDYLDPDTGAADDDGLLVTPVLNVYFDDSVVLRAGVDVYRYRDTAGRRRTAGEAKLSWQANF
jgi:hypothetical protein